MCKRRIFTVLSEDGTLDVGDNSYGQCGHGLVPDMHTKATTEILIEMEQK